MRSKILFSIFLLGTNLCFSQLKQKVADKLYAEHAYAKCVEMYEELADKVFENKKGASWENVRRAAHSNFQLFRMQKAILYFQKMYGSGNLLENDYENYIYALRFIGDYEEATKMIEFSHKLYPQNLYISGLHDQSEQFQSLFADTSSSRLIQLNINSEKGDFAPTFRNQNLVYATKSRNTEVTHPRYSWDNSYYISLLEAQKINDSVFGKPELLKNEFLSRAHDGPVSFNPNGKEMLITKNTLGKRKGKESIVLGLYFSEFKEGKWQELKAFPFNNVKYNVGHACYSKDGKTIYFSSDKPDGFGGADIYKSVFDGSAWSEPINLGAEVNTIKDELFPFVTEDKLFFASNGHFGLGGLDIFEASINGNSKVQNLGYPLNSSADDFGLITDSTGRNGYLSTNRNDNIDRIFGFKRNPAKILLEVFVFEHYSYRDTLKGQMVTLINQQNNEIFLAETDSSGIAKFNISKNETYTLYTNKNYFKLKEEVNFTSEQYDKDTTLYQELALLPTTIQVSLKVLEKKTGKRIPEATVQVTKGFYVKDTTLLTDQNGMVNFIVDRFTEYKVYASKKGFIDAETNFTTTDLDDKIYELRLDLNKIQKGEKFKLENIFYDLNKSTLRPESKSSLDLLADFIIKNDLKIELSSHTDARGSDAYNIKLSQARAQSCVDYLISKGVKKSSIKAKGYGETQLLNKCKNNIQCSEEEHQENRRTEVKILDF